MIDIRKFECSGTGCSKQGLTAMMGENRPRLIWKAVCLIAVLQGLFVPWSPFFDVMSPLCCHGVELITNHIPQLGCAKPRILGQQSLRLGLRLNAR